MTTLADLRRLRVEAKRLAKAAAKIGKADGWCGDTYRQARGAATRARTKYLNTRGRVQDRRFKQGKPTIDFD